MRPAPHTRESGEDVVVVGAGIAGLTAAALLAQAGQRVTVLERHEGPGGKLRQVPSPAGPVDAGPTVLTLRPVFEALMAALGERLEDHLVLVRQSPLARHFWTDGSRLDLFDSEAENLAAIHAFAGARAAKEFRAFARRARSLFDAFDAPVMRSDRPDLVALTARLVRNPALLWRMAPGSSLASLLDRAFTDRRLAQLFGRYATYVGGTPDRAPALLSLIWEAEAQGVWTIEGGMHALARTLAALAEARGARFVYGADVARIAVRDGAVTGVELADGTRVAAARVVFNGDPRALALGALGPDCTGVARQTLREPRSLSAQVWAFAAQASGPELAHHNVFFCDDPRAEFAALDRGEPGATPTLYVCAMDRGAPRPPPPLERFEIIANAPPLGHPPQPDEVPECRTRTFETLAGFGLTFDPVPTGDSLTTPAQFDRLFPHSAGSLYGQSPNATMAAFRRPTARTPIRGLFLAGGGTHPGAGLPMATLSGWHAAGAIMTGPASTSPSRLTAMRGGTSTASATTAPAPSRSSGS